MIKNLGATIDALKPFLREYLILQKTQFRNKHFTCPNKEQHKHKDAKPSANFYPDDNHWFCFVCSSKGDILNACNMIEDKPIRGTELHETLAYLCKLFKVSYEAVTDNTAEGKFLNELQLFLQKLVETGHETLKESIRGVTNNTITFLKEKEWLASVDKFKLGTILKVNAPNKSIQDFCDYLNLDLQSLVGNIIIPIFENQKIVGFQLRMLSGEVKYQTYIASLGRKLFNIDNINPADPVYVVEGASSVITLNSYGITNVVATLSNNFDEKHYEDLVRLKVKQCIILYDNDDGGKNGRYSVCKTCSNKPDLEISFGLIDGVKDPGDYIIKNKKIDDIPLHSMWDYLKIVNSNELLFTYIANQIDLIKKENLINDVCKFLKATKQTIIEEVKKRENDVTVTTVETLQEKESLVEVLNEYEQWAWSRGQLLGLKSFQSFDKTLDGIQQGLILISGSPNIGKSASMVSIALQMLETNRDIYIVYLTIDDSSIITLSRFLANLSGLPINTVSNPKYRILQNPSLNDTQKKAYMLKREKALSYLRDKVSLFNLKDASSGYTLEYLQHLLYTTKSLFKNKSLVVFVDNLHKLRSDKYFRGDKVMADLISNNLKLLSSTYHCPVIATAETTKQAIQSGDVSGSAIKETSSLQFDANLIISLSHRQVVHDSLKLMDLIINKNKFSTFIGKLPFRFYPDISKLEEDTISEDTFS